MGRLKLGSIRELRVHLLDILTYWSVLLYLIPYINISHIEERWCNNKLIRHKLSLLYSLISINTKLICNINVDMCSIDEYCNWCSSTSWYLIAIFGWIALRAFLFLCITDGIVCITMGYRLDGRGSIPVRGKRLFCGPPIIITTGYRGLFSRGQSDRGLKLTTHIHLLLLRSWMMTLYVHFHIGLHDVVLN
jgi:hypothetical protein